MFHCQCIHLSIDVEDSEKIDNKTEKQTGHVVRFGAIIYSDLVHSLDRSFLVTVTMPGGCG